MSFIHEVMKLCSASASNHKLYNEFFKPGTFPKEAEEFLVVLNMYREHHGKDAVDLDELATYCNYVIPKSPHRPDPDFIALVEKATPSDDTLQILLDKTHASKLLNVAADIVDGGGTYTWDAVADTLDTYKNTAFKLSKRLSRTEIDADETSLEDDMAELKATGSGLQWHLPSWTRLLGALST